MSAVEFFKSIVLTNGSIKDISLNNLTETFELENLISLTKQSLDEKFDKESVEFVKRMLRILLEKSLSEKSQNFGNLLDEFASVRIKDATSFKLSPNMAKKYRASLKNTEQSILKIQYEYDLKNGKIYDLSLHSFIETDRKDARITSENIKKNDLIIRDLAYVSLPMIETVIEKEAFFLNRFDFTSNAYETAEGKEKIHFGKIQQYLKKHKLQQTEKKVFIGEKQRIPVRMIIVLLPENEVEKRIRKLKRTESKKQMKYSEKYKAKLSLNVYVTNIGSEKLPIEQVRQIYRLRWQIEIVFKAWKSIGKIEKVKKMKEHRIETMLYAKLILLILCNEIYWNITLSDKKPGNTRYSIFKTYKILIHHIKEIKIAIKQGIVKSKELFEILIRMILKKCKLEKKKGTISSKEIMELNFKKNSIYVYY